MKRNRTLCFSFTLILALFFTSCATTVKVNLTRPAQLDLNGAKTISVLPFKPYYYYKKADVSIGKQIVITTFYQIFDIRDPDEQLAMNTLKNQIERGLSDSPYIKLVSSDAVQQSLKKGTLNPADVYLTGEVIYFNITDKRSDKKKQIKAAEGNKLAEYQIISTWRREATFNFKYQIVDSADNRIIAFDEVHISKVSSEYDTKKMLPSAYSLLETDVKATARKILRELQPYTVTKSIKLLETKTKDKELKERMKAVDEIVKNNRLTEASDKYAEIYEETGLVEAGYNAAILQEALGNLSVAEKLMVDLYSRYPESRVEKGLSDIRYEIQQAKRLNKQIKATEASGDLDDFDDVAF